MSTAPVFAPDGALGDIPAEKLPEALKAGFKPGVTMKSPDGKTGVVPSDRVQEASKSGLQVVPFKEQETQHPGFWASMGADLKSMVPSMPSSLSEAAKDVGKRALSVSTMGVSDLPAAMQSAEQRYKAGHGLGYTATAAAAEGLGANVRGMEQSADEGDTAGVLGHAATVPAVAAATLGAAKLAPKIPGAASATVDAAKAIGDSKIGQTVSTVAKAGAKLADVSTFERLSKGANVLKDGVQKLADIWRTPGASLDDMTDHLAQVIADDRARQSSSTGKELGLIKPTGAKSAAETGEALANPPESSDTPTGGKAATAPRFTMQDRMRAKELLQDSLSRGTQKVVDSVIPKSDTTYGANLQTKAAVDFNLQRGDVAGAEKVIDTAAKQANPSWQPLQRTPAPTVEEIRARIQQGPGSKADSLETRGIQEQMRNDLALHGWSAEAEARREFIARNSTGVTKGDLVRAAGGVVPEHPVKLTTTPSAAASGKGTPAADLSTDLTDILQQSLDAAKKRKSQK